MSHNTKIAPATQDSVDASGDQFDEGFDNPDYPGNQRPPRRAARPLRVHPEESEPDPIFEEAYTEPVPINEPKPAVLVATDNVPKGAGIDLDDFGEDGQCQVAAPGPNDGFEDSDTPNTMPATGIILRYPHLGGQLWAMQAIDYHDPYFEAAVHATAMATSPSPHAIREALKKVSNDAGQLHDLRAAAKTLQQPGTIEAMSAEAPADDEALKIVRDHVRGIIGPGGPLEEAAAALNAIIALELEPSVAASSHDDADQYTPFPTHVLPAPMSMFIAEVAKAVGVDPAAVALPALTMAGAAIGCSHKVQAKRGFSVYPILWTAIVMESGHRKSPAIRAALAPIYAQQFADAAAYRANKKIEANDEAEAKHATQAYGVKRTVIDKAAFPHRLTTDATQEAIDAALATTDRGILLARDELGGLFKSANEYKGGRGADIQKLIERYEGDPVKRDRKSEPEPVLIRRNATWITGGMQPATLWQIMSGANESNGLLARLLVAQPPASDIGYTEDELSEETEAAWASMIKDLYALPCDTEPTIIHFDAAALEKLKHWINANRAAINVERDGNVRQLRSKLDGTLLKFALIIHLIERLDDDGSLGIDIPAATVDRAIVLCDWFATEAARVYRRRTDVEAQAGDAEYQRILQMIHRRYPNGITARELLRATGRRFWKVEEAQTWIDAAVADGKGKVRIRPSGPHGGRPTQAFTASASP